MSLRLRLLRTWLARVEKRHLAQDDLATARAAFEAKSRLFRRVRGVRYRPTELGGRPALEIVTGVAGPGRLIWFHGGAHVMGSPRTHRAMVARLARDAGLDAVLPDFRLAPEHPFPAALEDAEAAWAALRADHAAGDLILGGDSSGGGLMLALLARLLARGERPHAVVALAPWTDLTGTAPSLGENAGADSLLPVSRFDEARGYYLAGTDPRDPGASPLFAAFPRCPPMFLQVSTSEILRDDSLRLAERLRAEGSQVVLDLWENTPHVAAIFQGWLPEADEMLARAAAFIRAQSRDPRSAGS